MKYSDSFPARQMYIFPHSNSTVFIYLFTSRNKGKFHEENSTLPQKYLFAPRICVVFYVCNAHIFQSMPVLEIQLSSWDNITDLLKLRPNFCPKVDQEVKIIVKVVKIIDENNIPTCIFVQSLSFHDFKILYRLNVNYLDWWV